MAHFDAIIFIENSHFFLPILGCWCPFTTKEETLAWHPITSASLSFTNSCEPTILNTLCLTEFAK